VGAASGPGGDVGPLDEMRIRLSVVRDGDVAYNDEVSVEDLKHHPALLAEWLVRGLDFPHGAFLMTGTAIVPPSDFTLTPGDHVNIAITGLGELRNPVELLRTGAATPASEAAL
jgi:2-dehydro-3-deoxy-D-arabinonate dehydratase